MDSFFTNREFTRPFTSGLRMQDMTRAEMSALTAELTDEERANPFSAYYDEPIAPLQPQMQQALAGGPLKAEQMYMPNEAGRILLGGSIGYPLNGYGVLENGVGYSSMVVHQDGITDEMIAKYRESFAVTDDPGQRNLFYKTWCPGKHKIHFEDGIIEDFGYGFCLQTMDWSLFNIEKHFGFSQADIPQMDPNCLNLIVVGGPCELVDNPEDRTETCMIQYTRETENGRDLCIHYWNGVELTPDGGIKVCPNVGPEEMTRRMRGMMEHAMMECCNEVAHIREYWNA